MTEAYAIKDSNGEIIAIGMTQAQAWNAAANRIAASAETVHSCVPVVVSEKGEAEALLKSASALLGGSHNSTLFEDQCDHLASQIDAYLSRGQG